MMPAGGAEFLQLQPILVLLFVLRRRIIPILTVSTLQCDDFAHRFKGLQTAPSFSKSLNPPVFLHIVG
jgi:hypothetical protein